MNSFVTRRAVAVAAAAFLALGTAGAIAQQQPAPQQAAATAEAEISIQSFQFVPAILTIKPGTYDYLCAVHPHMRGKIVVE